MAQLKSFGRKAGLTPSQIDDLDRFRDSTAYSGLQKLVLQYTEDLVERTEIRAEIISELRKYLSERELVELKLTIGVAVMLTLVTRSTQAR
jgi:hypothetical protein